LPFGFVLAQLQVFFNLRIRQRPMIGTARQKAKIQLPHRYIISVNALILEFFMNRMARFRLVASFYSYFTLPFFHAPTKILLVCD